MNFLTKVIKNRHHVLFLFMLLFGFICHAQMCVDLFAQPLTKYTWADGIRSNLYKRLNGEKQITKIDKILSESYKLDIPHTRILENIFGFKLNPEFGYYVPTVNEIVFRYKTHMDSLVKQGILSSADLLLPEFVISFNSESFGYLPVGESLPKGAEFSKIVSEKFYYQMISDGKFPMTIKLFEHDLAHFTSFVEDPQYMKMFKQYISQKNLQPNHSFKSQKLREFFVFEGLFLFRSELRSEIQKFILLPKRQNLSQLTLTEVSDYLKSMPKDEVNKMLTHLLNNFENYFKILGGAARDNYNKYQEPNHLFMDTIPDFIRTAIRSQKLEDAAKVQILILRAMNIRLEDWFEAIQTSHLQEDTPVYKFFADKEIWEQHPLRMTFLREDYELNEK
ncbi:hypothetical protein [Pseudobdellovibrio sp. HCB154]|uniref:hypothetical protein n=1 Tax=Pseudobdellovibrio sp. HCB154 TaxID=3386277 RepID=UPI003916DAEC